ncbi:unnamed protein product [Peronospora belbahrii]|uniref:Uncharacterized protein n=1 Tax=Peronospora belbahrii TaxID=622444 RepID=A0AAU9KZ46_9STRA|nr:unnamed protein product [Peronospora belbahrii]
MIVCSAYEARKNAMSEPHGMSQYYFPKVFDREKVPHYVAGYHQTTFSYPMNQINFKTNFASLTSCLNRASSIPEAL